MNNLKVKKKHIYLFFIIVVFLCSIIGIYKFYKYRTEAIEEAKKIAEEIESTETADDSENGYNNGVFTEELYENIIEIDYVYATSVNAESKIAYTSQDEIDSIYKLFASLELTSTEDPEKYGGADYAFVTNDKTIYVSVYGDIVSLSTGYYSCSPDISDQLTDMLISKVSD